MPAQTNKQIIDAIIQKFPTFQGHTSQLALKLMTEKGFGEVQRQDVTFVNDFFGLLVTTWLNVVNISQARDPLRDAGFVEHFDLPYGGVTRRMSVNSVMPVNPAWINLQNGDSPDPFKVHKPVTNERFYKQNFDFQAWITIPDNFQFKNMFISNYGISEYMAGIMEGLRNSYTLQRYVNTLECLNAAINSTEHPLQPTQTVNIEIAEAEPTVDELKQFVLNVRNVVSMMSIAPQTGAFNAYGFKSTQDKSRLRLLIRPGFLNNWSVNVLSSTYNPQDLALGVDIIEVPNFGGLKPFTDANFTTPAYTVYDEDGRVMGYSATEGSQTAELTENQVFWQDPNKDVYAILADRGVLFETQANPVITEPIRNPRGRYTNYFTSSPGNGIHYDSLYNMVLFKIVEGSQI